MQLSSLIFLVIVAIWAAYLIQHWVRRREHIATARSVDRFSEAMRVLERRNPLPRPELATPHPHSYAVKPPASRPAVVVKRATAVAAATAREQEVWARVSERVPHRSPLTARRASQVPGASPSGAGDRSGSQEAQTRGTSVARTRSQMLVRRARGVAVLVTLGAVPVTVALAVANVLLWVSVPIAVAAFAGVVTWLRIAVLHAQSRRQTAHAPRARPATRSAGTAAGPAQTAVSPAEHEDEVCAQPTPRELASRVVFDAAAPVSRAEQPAPTGVVVEAPLARAPGGWSPIPVPPPTYTLKDAAPRRAPEPAEVTQRPVPIEVEDDEIELMLAAHQRRVVG